MSDIIIQGKRFKPSNRPSSDVKVGDWVKIHESIPSSEYWGATSKAQLGTFQQVSGKLENLRVELEPASGYWDIAYFTIMEEIPEQPKIPRNHPHADMIRQWLDDASLEVECRVHKLAGWAGVDTPTWQENLEYRFKPKTVPAWQVLYEFEGEIELTSVHYTTEEDFTSSYGRQNQKFIKFVLETEKQVQA